ncbi:MAG: cell division protein FtsA [Tannerella sp.]|jgi:cell division protein FtsA|nr:cell division protein FtsA [Tannerella sp.]
MTDYIVAIDLGTSHITGIVGEKNADGTFSIVAYETENTLSSCIHRGNIYNVDNTADHVKSLIRKLESHLKGGFIDRIYVGAGGQSVRTTDHVETKKFEDGEVVSAEDIRTLEEQCGKYNSDLLDVLEVVPATYYVDGRRGKNPVGVSCKRLEARYKMVVGRMSVRRNIAKSIKDRCGKEIAGIIVSPLALADAMLSKEEKEVGCALVDFGAGVTSVTIYKNGDLLYSVVIPLGSALITRDITSLQLTEEVSEKLKKEYGSALFEEDDEVINIDMEGSDREIPVNDLNAIVEARAKEIVENVHERISKVIEIKSLGAGIVLAGCASGLKKLPELIKAKCKVKPRYSAIREGLVRGDDDIIGNPLYMTVVSLLLKGTKQCVSFPAAPVTPVIEDDKNGKEDEKDKEIKKGLFRRNKKNNKPDPVPDENPKDPGTKEEEKKGWGNLFGDLFSEN